MNAVWGSYGIKDFESSSNKANYACLEQNTLWRLLMLFQPMNFIPTVFVQKVLKSIIV